MKFKPTNGCCGRAKRRQRAFTLAETLAALVFMAIVVPVAVQGLQIASLAGQIGQRKGVAGRVADRVLNELVATGQWRSPGLRGTVYEGVHEYDWTVESRRWEIDALTTLTVVVLYTVQDREYELRVTTLVNPNSL